LKRRKAIILGTLAAAALGAGWWWNEHRSVPLHDVFNPSYWVHRWRGEDLYDPATRRLFHGNHDLKEVALTIDDGPHTPTGDQILDILKEYDVKATFFLVGRRMEERPDLVCRMLAEGHEVGNHTQDHIRLDSLNQDQIRREINDADIHYYRITGRHFDMMRPPGVRYNEKVLKVANELGYQTILYTCAAKDFEDVTPDFIVKRVLSRVANGAIILLHDERPATVTALPRILSALKSEGYRFVTVSEMMSRLPKPVVIQKNGVRHKSG
jgi:peptidoglycan-N-acetylglucosamine deacetylase